MNADGTNQQQISALHGGRRLQRRPVLVARRLADRVRVQPWRPAQLRALVRPTPTARRRSGSPPTARTTGSPTGARPRAATGARSSSSTRTPTPNDGDCTRAHCTLREAIAVANGNPGRAPIDFDIDGQPATIRLTSALPAVTESGRRSTARPQPGYEGSPVVRVDALPRGRERADAEHGREHGERPRARPRDDAGLAITGDDNRVKHSVIGMDDLDNGIGVLVNGSDNTIGEYEDGNTIAYNSGDGVAIVTGTGNRISRNSIHSNGALGIDLAPNGVTANDNGDLDEGANERQNFPVLTSVEASRTSFDRRGHDELARRRRTSRSSSTATRSATPPVTARVAFLGSESIVLNGDGNGDVRGARPDREGGHVRHARPRPTSNSDTSEFSACRSVGDSGEGLTLTVDAGSNPAGSGTLVGPARVDPVEPAERRSPAPPTRRRSARSRSARSRSARSRWARSRSARSRSAPSRSARSRSARSRSARSRSARSGRTRSRSARSASTRSCSRRCPVDWATILAGTPLAARMLQTLTLQDVYANATARGRFEQLLQASDAERGLRARSSAASPSPRCCSATRRSARSRRPGAASWCDAITEAGGCCAGVDPSTNTVAGPQPRGHAGRLDPGRLDPGRLDRRRDRAARPSARSRSARSTSRRRRSRRSCSTDDPERERGRRLRADQLHDRPHARPRGRAHADGDPPGRDARRPRRCSATSRSTT